MADMTCELHDCKHVILFMHAVVITVLYVTNRSRLTRGDLAGIAIEHYIIFRVNTYICHGDVFAVVDIGRLVYLGRTTIDKREEETIDAYNINRFDSSPFCPDKFEEEATGNKCHLTP